MNKMVYISDNSTQDYLESIKPILQDLDLSKIHDCEKCRGKIVSITVDKMGITRCGYCGQVVPYMEFIKNELQKKTN